MLLSVRMHMLPVKGQQLWVWEVSDESLEQLSDQELIEQGWELVETEKLPFPLLALRSQLCEMIPVLTIGQTVVKAWIKTEDLLAVAEHPIILAYRSRRDESSQPALIHYPPATLAEIGLIQEHGQVILQPLTDLGSEGEQIQHALHHHLSEAVSSTDSDQATTAWSAARHAARTLASLYWKQHLQGATAKGGQVTVIPYSDDARKRPRVRVPLADLVLRNPATVAVPGGEITQFIMRGLISQKLYDVSEEQQGRHLAQHRKSLSAGQGEIIIQLRQQNDETWEEFLDLLARLDVGLVDTFCSLEALAFDNPDNPEHDLTKAFWVNVDDILHLQRRKMSNRTFESWQREQIIRHIDLLARIRILFTIPGSQKPDVAALPSPRRRGRKPKNTSLTTQSPPVDKTTTRYLSSTLVDLLGSIIGEYLNLNGDVLWQRRQMKLGAWAEFATINAQTIQLHRTIMAYHERKQYVAKQLGYWASARFLAPAVQATRSVELTIGELIEQSVIPLGSRAAKSGHPENPSRLRRMLEDGMAQLRLDNIIGWYGKAPLRPLPEESPAQFQHRCQEDAKRQVLIDQCAQGWWKHFATQVWRFDLPHRVDDLFHGQRPYTKPAHAVSHPSVAIGSDQQLIERVIRVVKETEIISYEGLLTALGRDSSTWHALHYVLLAFVAFKNGRLTSATTAYPQLLPKAEEALEHIRKNYPGFWLQLDRALQEQAPWWRSAQLDEDDFMRKAESQEHV